MGLQPRANRLAVPMVVDRKTGKRTSTGERWTCARYNEKVDPETGKTLRNRVVYFVVK